MRSARMPEDTFTYGHPRHKADTYTAYTFTSASKARPTQQALAVTLI